MHPARPAMAAPRLRRSSVPVTRIRSTSFSSSAASLRPARPAPCSSFDQGICTRPRLICDPTSKTTHVTTRARSSWTGHTRPGRLIGWRFASTLHDPDCKWIRSKDGPIATPRDKSCAACKDAEAQPEEVSPAELWWERRMHKFREAVDKDPYDALFGWSNDMLRGRPFRPRWAWEDEIKPWSLKGIQAEHEAIRKRGLKIGEIFDGDGSKPAKKVVNSSDAAPKEQHRARDFVKSSPLDATPYPEKPARKVKIDTSPAEQITVKTSSVSEAEQKSPPRIQAYSEWTYRSVDAHGKSQAWSGSSVYDPISGRMVPVVESGTALEDNASSIQTTSLPTAKPSPTTNNGSSAALEEEIQDRIGVQQPSPTASREDEIARRLRNSWASVQSSRFSTSDNASDPSEDNLRIQLYEEAEKSLAIARESITSMMKSNLSDVPQRGPVITPLSKTLLCLRNTQLALEAYKEQSPLNMISPDLAARKHNLEASWRRDPKRATTTPKHSPHFTQISTSYPLKDYGSDAQSRQVYDSLHRHRNRPLKQLSAHELQNHKTLLLKTWEKKRSKLAAVKSPADQRLDQEIDAQKNMYAAWENKRSRSQQVDSRTDAVAPVAQASQAAPVAGGEGDMCPNVAKYCNVERMYKRKAPHALANEEIETSKPTVPMPTASGTAVTTEVWGTPELRKTVNDMCNKSENWATPEFKESVNNLCLKSFGFGMRLGGLSAAESDEMLLYQKEYIKQTGSKSPFGLPGTTVKTWKAVQRAKQQNGSPKEQSGLAQRSESSAGSSTVLPAPYLAVRYNERERSFKQISATSHPDGWTQPRLSPNGCLEVLRSKGSYPAHILPKIEDLRRQGYALYDIARDNEHIVFKHQHQGAPSATTAVAVEPSKAPVSISAFSTASAAPPSIVTSGVMKQTSSPRISLLSAQSSPVGKAAATSNIAATPKTMPGEATNPVDPVLRQQPPQTQTGNFASPTGFVNLDALTSVTTSASRPPIAADTEQDPSKDAEVQIKQDRPGKPSAEGWGKHHRMRKQEVVFSGGQARGRRYERGYEQGYGAAHRSHQLYYMPTFAILACIAAYFYGKHIEDVVRPEQQRRQQEALAARVEEEARKRALPAAFWEDKTVSGEGGAQTRYNTRALGEVCADVVVLAVTLRVLTWVYMKMLEP